jgi:hypothetical protein
MVFDQGEEATSSMPSLQEAAVVIICREVC